MQALLAKQRAAKAEDAEYDLAKKRLWLSHNWPGEYERCAVVGGRHVCRRCSTLYPVALLVTVASFLGFAPWPASMDLFFIFALCVPATAEFLAEKILGWAYNSRRQVAVTFLLAPALGRGFWYEIQDRWTLEFWGPALATGVGDSVETVNGPASTAAVEFVNDGGGPPQPIEIPLVPNAPVESLSDLAAPLARQSGSGAAVVDPRMCATAPLIEWDIDLVSLFTSVDPEAASNGRLSAVQIYAIARSAGFCSVRRCHHDRHCLGLNLVATRWRTTGTGEDSWGLWQINLDAHGWWADDLELTDPLTNAEAAFRVSRAGKTFVPWSVTHADRGAPYLRYLPVALAAAEVFDEAGGIDWADQIEKWRDENDTETDDDTTVPIGEDGEGEDGDGGEDGGEDGDGGDATDGDEPVTRNPDGDTGGDTGGDTAVNLPPREPVYRAVPPRSSPTVCTWVRHRRWCGVRCACENGVVPPACTPICVDNLPTVGAVCLQVVWVEQPSEPTENQGEGGEGGDGEGTDEGEGTTKVKAPRARPSVKSRSSKSRRARSPERAKTPIMVGAVGRDTRSSAGPDANDQAVRRICCLGCGVCFVRQSRST
ncbi:hypothetical protein GQR58_030040 [Nymphon striatum]|nr:hypothetical protein GQR58_030040 [Nymphon striatum]